MTEGGRGFRPDPQLGSLGAASRRDRAGGGGEGPLSQQDPGARFSPGPSPPPPWLAIPRAWAGLGLGESCTQRQPALQTPPSMQAEPMFPAETLLWFLLLLLICS